MPCNIKTNTVTVQTYGVNLDAWSACPFHETGLALKMTCREWKKREKMIFISYAKHYTLETLDHPFHDPITIKWGETFFPFWLDSRACKKAFFIWKILSSFRHDVDRFIRVSQLLLSSFSVYELKLLLFKVPWDIVWWKKNHFFLLIRYWIQYPSIVKLF